MGLVYYDWHEQEGLYLPMFMMPPMRQSPTSQRLTKGEAGVQTWWSNHIKLGRTPTPDIPCFITEAC